MSTPTSDALPIVSWTEGRMRPWRSDYVFPYDPEFGGGGRNDHHGYVTVVLDDEKAEAIEKAYFDHHWYREGIEAVLGILGVEFRGDPRDMGELHIKNETWGEIESRMSYAYIMNQWKGPGTYYITCYPSGRYFDSDSEETHTYECEDVEDWRRAVETWFGVIGPCGRLEDDRK